jgi:hypothetical protein
MSFPSSSDANLIIPVSRQAGPLHGTHHGNALEQASSALPLAFCDRPSFPASRVQLEGAPDTFPMEMQGAIDFPLSPSRMGVGSLPDLSQPRTRCPRSVASHPVACWPLTPVSNGMHAQSLVRFHTVPSALAPVLSSMSRPSSSLSGPWPLVLRYSPRTIRNIDDDERSSSSEGSMLLMGCDAQGTIDPLAKS